MLSVVLHLSIAAALCTPCASGQADNFPSPLHGQAKQTDQSGPEREVVPGKSWPEVILNVLVFDQSGQPSLPVNQPAFQLLQDAVPQRIQSVNSADTAISLGLVIDDSGSTRNSRDQIIDAAVALIKAMRASSEVMVATFSDELFLDLPFTPVLTADLSVFGRLQSKGGTAMFEALTATENYFVANAHQRRRALVVISDGDDNVSSASLEDTVRTLQLPGAPTLYALSVPGNGTRFKAPGEFEREQRNLRTLSGVEGGVALFPRKNKDMASSARQTAAIIRSQYALTYTSSETAASSPLHKIELRVAANPAKADLHYLSAFYAPAASR